MRFSSYALPALAANLVAAMPKPQDIDLDMVIDTPDPTFSEAVGVAAQTVTYDTASVIAAATSAVSSVSIEISDVLSQTAVVSKRAAATTCAPQPSGATSAPTYAADADNAANFLANTYYASVASAAPTPAGYSQAFVAQQASNQAYADMVSFLQSNFELTYKSVSATWDLIHSTLTTLTHVHSDALPRMDVSQSTCISNVTHLVNFRIFPLRPNHS